MSLYHRAGALLVPGERIAPGNWGRVIAAAGPNHNRFYPEYLLERIRTQEFPDKPSRMTAAFAFEDRDYAINWVRPNAVEYVYEVTLEVDVPTHRGDMSWVDAMADYRTFNGVESCARRYWSGDQQGNDESWEILTSGPLLIAQRITWIPDDEA